jgi:hypothetical protein
MSDGAGPRCGGVPAYSSTTRRLRDDRDLEHRRDRPRLSFNARRHERLSPVRQHDDVTGLEVRCGMLEEAEVLRAADGRRRHGRDHANAE